MIITADDKALKFIPDLEEARGCEMPQEEPAEKDLEVGMGNSNVSMHKKCPSNS